MSSRTVGLAPAAAQIAIGVVDRAGEDVQVVVQRVELGAGDHQLPLAELQLRRPLAGDPVPLPATLRAELARSPTPTRLGEHPPAPPTTSLPRALLRRLFRHDEIMPLLSLVCVRRSRLNPAFRGEDRLSDTSSGEDVVEAQLGLVVLDPLQPVTALEQRHQLAVAAFEDPDPADLAEPIGRRRSVSRIASYGELKTSIGTLNSTSSRLANTSNWS